MSTEPNNTGYWKLCVVIPNGNGAMRIVACGNKKGMDAAAKTARRNNPHLAYVVRKLPSTALGDLIDPASEKE